MALYMTTIYGFNIRGSTPKQKAHLNLYDTICSCIRYAVTIAPCETSMYLGINQVDHLDNQRKAKIVICIEISSLYRG